MTQVCVGTSSGPYSLLQIATAALSGLTVVLLSILSWWMVSQTNRLAAAELALQDVRTWRETLKPQLDADHALLVQVSQVMHERTVQLDQTVALVRDLKGVLDSMAASQVALRVHVERIEQQLEQRKTR